MPFLRWWVGQLAGLVPARLLHAYVESGDATILEIAADGFALHVRRKGAVTRVGKGGLRDLKQAMASVADLPQLRLLRVPADQALRKRLSLPIAVRRDLKTVLGFEIDRETPFEQGEVYWNYSIAGQDVMKNKLDIDLVVVPRRVGDAMAETARKAGFDPAALEVANDNAAPALLWLKAFGGAHAPLLPSRTRPLMTAIYGLSAAVIIMPFAVQEVHFFLADRTIAALETEARAAAGLNQAANRRIAALEFLGHAQGGHGSALEVVLAASRALPDETFLTALGVHDGKVTMTGASEAAAGLIPALAKSPAFRDPVFDAAVLEGEDGLENFTISVTLALTAAP